MRTTLTLDPDVVKLLEAEVHRARKPLKQVVNAALRRGLGHPRAPVKPYRVPVHRALLLPGVDRARLNARVDELEDEALLSRASARR